MPLPTAPGRTGQTAVAPRRIPSELIHLVLWALAVALLAGMLQGLAWLIGWRLDIRDQGGVGRGIVLALAAGGVFSVIAAERRSPAEYGLLIDDRWAKQLLGGCAVGMLVYAGYCFLTVYLGALSGSGPVKPGRWVSAAFTALLAFVIAPLQEIVFRGYLLGLAKNRLGTPAAVLLVSCLFSLSLQFHTNPSMLAVENHPLLTGMFLAGTLFALMRLHHGSVMAPIGLLSGWLFVEILIRRTHLIATINDPLLAYWLCPQKDPRRAPVLWLILAVAILGYILLLRRSPTTRSSEKVTSMSLSFKKFFPFSNLGMMAPLDLWLTRLWHARFAVGWIYVPRLVAILTISALNTLLCLPERLLLPVLLSRRRVPDPVFILGVHRSGTTHLHNLLALDPRFVTPKTYQVMNPIGFLFSGWILIPLLALFSPRKRPMDAVDFSFFTPNEDEFALAHTAHTSPHWGYTFPRQAVDYDRYIFPERFSPRERSQWKQDLLLFLQKLCLFSSRRPLLKNPFNTARVSLLRELFPGAKFVHIHRNPYAVYRSNVHLAREGLCVFQLQDPEEGTAYPVRFLDHYLPVEEAFYAQAARLPRHQVAEVRFEDLETDPLTQVEKLYGQLEMELSAVYRERLERYLESIAGYRKNKFQPLPEEQRQQVFSKLGPLFQRWGYDP